MEMEETNLENAPLDSLQNISTELSEPDLDQDMVTGNGKLAKKRRKEATDEGCPSEICEDCGKSFGSATLLNGHRLHQHNPKRREYECAECLQKFKQGASLWTHYYRFHMEKDLLPGEDLEQLIVEGKKDNCDGSLSSSSTICGICGKVYQDPSSLKRHVEKEHEAPGLRYPCPECGKDFKDRDWMVAHRKKVHLGTVKTRCGECGREMGSEGKLWRHRMEVHGMGGKEAGEGLESVKWERCGICGEVVLGGKGWMGHLREKHGVEEEERELRRRREEKRERERKRHRTMVRVRVRKGEWRCGKEGCGRVFTRKEHLRRHLMEMHCELEERIVERRIVRVEEGVREGEGDRYECTLCGERFGHRVEVKIHVVRGHPEVYRDIVEGREVKVMVKCPMEGCGVEREGEEEVRRHLEEMHGEECWRCPECERVMLSPEEMEVHWGREHGDGGDDEGMEEGGKWLWRRTAAGWSRKTSGMIGVEGMEELKKKRKAVYNKFGVMRCTCEICGLGLSFERYGVHLKRCHGVEEGEWSCEICEGRKEGYGGMGKGKGKIKRREGWLGHMEWKHGGEVDMEVMVERAKKMNVEGGVEGLAKVHWKKWVNGQLAKVQKKGNKRKRGKRRTIKGEEKQLKLSAKLEEMQRNLEREKRLIVGPLKRVEAAVEKEILHLDEDS